MNSICFLFYRSIELISVGILLYIDRMKSMHPSTFNTCFFFLPELMVTGVSWSPGLRQGQDEMMAKPKTLKQNQIQKIIWIATVKEFDWPTPARPAVATRKQETKSRVCRNSISLAGPVWWSTRGANFSDSPQMPKSVLGANDKQLKSPSDTNINPHTAWAGDCVSLRHFIARESFGSDLMTPAEHLNTRTLSHTHRMMWEDSFALRYAGVPLPVAPSVSLLPLWRFTLAEMNCRGTADGACRHHFFRY